MSIIAVFGKEIVRGIWNMEYRGIDLPNLQLDLDGLQIFNRQRCGV